MDHAGTALLAVDPPILPGRPLMALPCRLLDGQLSQVGYLLADGRPHTVPAGHVVVIVETSQGPHARKVLRLDAGGDYRLHYVRGRGAATPRSAEAVADAQALETVSLLDGGRVLEARSLVEPRLQQVRAGQMGDPLATVAVAYVLTQTWETELLHPWCLELPRLHPQLADAYVVAAEWHALRGNHLTALNHLRQLQRLELPVFTVGLSRALDRLAGYKASNRQPVSVDDQEGETIRKSHYRGQVINSWDSEEARNAYLKLRARSEDLQIEAVTTRRAKAGGRWPSAATSMSPEFTGSHHRAPQAENWRESMAEDKHAETRLGGLPMYLAAAAVVLWMLFVAVLLFRVDTDTDQWTRLTFIFASVQAIAFAAAGALFGVAVQQKHVDKAEQQADDHERDATNGKALAVLTMADGGGDLIQQDGDSTFESFGPSDTDDAGVRRRHAEAARRLFPHL